MKWKQLELLIEYITFPLYMNRTIFLSQKKQSKTDTNANQNDLNCILNQLNKLKQYVLQVNNDNLFDNILKQLRIILTTVDQNTLISFQSQIVQLTDEMFNFLMQNTNKQLEFEFLQFILSYTRIYHDKQVNDSTYIIFLFSKLSKELNKEHELLFVNILVNFLLNNQDDLQKIKQQLQCQSCNIDKIVMRLQDRVIYNNNKMDTISFLKLISFIYQAQLTTDISQQFLENISEQFSNSVEKILSNNCQVNNFRISTEILIFLQNTKQFNTFSIVSQPVFTNIQAFVAVSVSNFGQVEIFFTEFLNYFYFALYDNYYQYEHQKRKHDELCQLFVDYLQLVNENIVELLLECNSIYCQNIEIRQLTVNIMDNIMNIKKFVKKLNKTYLVQVTAFLFENMLSIDPESQHLSIQVLRWLVLHNYAEITQDQYQQLFQIIRQLNEQCALDFAYLLIVLEQQFCGFSDLMQQFLNNQSYVQKLNDDDLELFKNTLNDYT